MGEMAQVAKHLREGVQRPMNQTYRVPVREVLTIGPLLSSKLLAGATGQERSVTDLSVVESPDALDGMRPHSFVMTSGFALKHLGAAEPGSQDGVTAERLCRLVSDLDDLEVAGLAIQFGRHLESLPDEVLTLADELGFPIVAIPADVPFAVIFSQVMVEIAEVRTDMLQRTYELHVILEGLLLDGADLQGICEQIAETLEVGVLITSVDGREMADALTGTMRERLVAMELFDASGRFRIERVRSPSTAVDAGEVLAESVVAAGDDLARLVAYAPDHTIGADVRYALQRASSILALMITQRQALNTVENKYRGDFLHDVLSGRSKNREHSMAYATGLGWRLDMPCIVVAAQLDPQAPLEEPATTRVRRSWQSRFHLAWTQVVGRESKTYPCADFSDEVVAILSAPPRDTPQDPAAVVSGLQDMVERIVHGVSGDRGGGRRPFSVGTSRLVTSFEQLPAAYQQARRATEVGRRFSGGSSTSHFDDLGIHRLIGLISDHHELTVFARDMLGELADESPHAQELRATLQVLLDNNLNVAEASRELVMHYNTMRYRITKLEKIVGPFTSDANLRLNVAVALQVRKIQQ